MSKHYNEIEEYRDFTKRPETHKAIITMIGLIEISEDFLLRYIYIFI
ncbi:hypothetical protein [Peribacillus sp. NPDC096540]